MIPGRENSIWSPGTGDHRASCTVQKVSLTENKTAKKKKKLSVHYLGLGHWHSKPFRKLVACWLKGCFPKPHPMPRSRVCAPWMWGWPQFVVKSSGCVIRSTLVRIQALLPGSSEVWASYLASLDSVFLVCQEACLSLCKVFEIDEQGYGSILLDIR